MNRRVLAVLSSLAVAAIALSQGFDAANAKDLKELAKLRTAYEASKAAMKARPKDLTARKKFIVDTDRYATATMTSNALGPRQKYPGALRLYREVLKVDPKNREAANNSAMIIGIYRQMGRKVPE